MRKKWFFYKKRQFFLIDSRQYAKIHTLFRKVADNDPMNISGKFEASMLGTFWEKSFIVHNDALKSTNSYFLILAPMKKL